jgi:hypothetical protein
MFNLDDFALHQTFGCVGKVIGYGHQMLDSVYLPTIKVRLVKGEVDLGGFLEDVASAWVRVEDTLDLHLPT